MDILSNSNVNFNATSLSWKPYLAFVEYYTKESVDGKYNIEISTNII